MKKRKEQEVKCRGCGMPLMCDCGEDNEHYCPMCDPYTDGAKPKEVEKRKKIMDLLNEARFCCNVSADDEEAISICDKILQLEPDNRDAMLIKAGSLPRVDRISEAKELIGKIKSMWPNHWEAYYLQGVAMFNENEQEAMREFEKSLDLEERFDNLISAAQLAYFMQRPIYKEYLAKAGKLDRGRFNNYMKNYWENELV